MQKPNRVDVGCQLIGEFVDEAEPQTETLSQTGGVVPTRMVGDYVDGWSDHSELHEFKVLFRDDRVAIVRGSGVRYIKGTTVDSFGVWTRMGGEKVLTAVFPVGDVVGIFNGDMQSNPRSE